MNYTKWFMGCSEETVHGIRGVLACAEETVHGSHVWWKYEPDNSASSSYAPYRCPGKGVPGLRIEYPDEDAAIKALQENYGAPEEYALAYVKEARGGKVLPINHQDGLTRYFRYDSGTLRYIITAFPPVVNGHWSMITHNKQEENSVTEEKTNFKARPTQVEKDVAAHKPPKYTEPDPNDQRNYRDAAARYLADSGLPLVPDAVDQLTDAFLPALRIICERGYHPEGNTWRAAGWRGILTDIRKKTNRLWYRSWIKGGFDSDSAMDLINFCAFYYRLGNKGKEWGEWGTPGQSEDSQVWTR